MNSREHILGRLRSRLGRTADNAVSGRSAVEARIAAHAAGPRPAARQQAEATELRERFCSRAAQLSSTSDSIDTLAAAPGRIAEYLRQQQLPQQAVCWPTFAALDWRAAQLDVSARPATGVDMVGITGCFCAIAETGTLLLCSGAQTPAATSLLPETHIAILPAARIVADMEAAWQLMRSELGAAPRAMNFISGPSRTGDIEQTIVLGAHGPYRVHILILADPA